VNDFEPRENTFFFGEEIASEEEYNQIIEDASLVWLIFPGFTNSSNTLTKAAFLKTPCIALAGSLIGERIQRYHLGGIVQYPKVFELRRVLLEMTWAQDGTCENKNLERSQFLKEFTEMQFGKRLRSGLEVFLEE
jgi:hypothetical protein